jgi:sortase (surface protein transpeptidase)
VTRLVALWLLVLVAGCGAPAATAPPPQASPGVAAPAAVDIPAIGASSTLISLGLDADGRMVVPDTAGQAAWYEPGVRPGETGPALITGHVDYAGEPGVFGRLDELTEGGEVLVTLEDGRRLSFVVYRVQQVSKAAFPWGEVAADTAGPELRLITCGGGFDRSAGHYRDNVIAYAREVP